MSLLVYLIHVCLEMLPISSSTHIGLICRSVCTASEVLAAHGPAALVYTAYSLPFGIHMVYYSQWYRMWRWCVAGAIADGITGCGYLIHRTTSIFHLQPWWGMVITSVLLVYISSVAYLRYRIMTPTYIGAMWIGVAQSVSFVPGVSRLAATYAVGRMLGWSHQCAFTFSCLLVVPLYAAYWVTVTHTSPLAFSALHGVIIILSLVTAYILLRITEYMFATGRAWYFAVYLAFVALILYGMHDHLA